jgi:hypothetical protein
MVKMNQLRKDVPNARKQIGMERIFPRKKGVFVEE